MVEIEQINGCEVRSAMVSMFCVRSISKRLFLILVQVTNKLLRTKFVDIVVPTSDRGDFWVEPVDILVFACPTGYMLTSNNFLLLNWGVYFIDSSITIGHFLAVLNFNRLFLKFNRFICN